MVYKIRSYVQHIAAQNIFMVVKRGKSFGTNVYRLRLVRTTSAYPIGAYTTWLSEDNLNEFYVRLDAKTVKVLYGN